MGRVTNVNNGEPVVGAAVQIEGAFKAATDANGDYTISDVPAGTHSVKARAKGFVSATQEVVLAEGEDKTGVDFALTPR